MSDLIRPIRWLCCLSLLGLFGSPLRAEEELRRQLEDVVFESRLCDLGLRLAREAYQAHAVALAEQPAKLGLVRYYQGLVEIEAHAPQYALEHFQAAASRLPKNSPWKQRADAWCDCLEAPASTLEQWRTEKPLPIWKQRVAVMVRPEAWGFDITKPQPAECLDAACAWVRLPTIPTELAEALEQISWTEQDVLWLNDDPDSSRDISYQFYDPGLFSLSFLAKARQLLWLAEHQNDSEARLIRVWCHLYLKAPQAADRVLQSFSEEDLLALSPRRRGELYCLGLVTAHRIGNEDRIEKWNAFLPGGDRCDLPTNGTDTAIPLWGLRAINLESELAERGVALAQESVRAMTGGGHPLDDQLMFPLTDRAAAQQLRSYYFEVGWAFRQWHARKASREISFPPPLSALRCQRILEDLSAPVRRLPDRSWPFLRTLMLADVSTWCGDFESWQNDWTVGMEQNRPLQAIAHNLARKAAAYHRLRRRSGPIPRQEEEQFAEPIEVLLAGQGGFVLDPHPTEIYQPEPAKPDQQPNPVAGEPLLWGRLLGYLMAIAASLTGIVLFAVWVVVGRQAKPNWQPRPTTTISEDRSDLTS